MDLLFGHKCYDAGDERQMTDQDLNWPNSIKTASGGTSRNTENTWKRQKNRLDPTKLAIMQ
ncbi:hypothetical protein CCR75_006625 [Bremia lactucae]|uniref:Uncharacterized protein n=1 Tax=Bremia lactucae TaxID=4779 RepID=A0A976FI57_BRELC|nr:hypothetical protein CCR75_006625 [Bremia lactucae]